MPRPRQHHTGLPPRLYRHGAGYRYVPRLGNPIKLPDDLESALKQYRLIREQETGEGYTVEWLLDWYLGNLAKFAPRNSEKTIAAKRKDALQVKRRAGHIPYREFAPTHTRQYLDQGVTEKRAVRANREVALLSHAFSCAREQGLVKENPCLRVRRNHEGEVDRFHEDADVLKVLDKCNVMTWCTAMLIYRTLQRTPDVLGWTASNIIERDGRRILSFVQSKTGARVEIAITPEIDEILARARTGRKIVGMTLIHNRRGQPYTETGMQSLWTSAKRRAGFVGPFGIYDMKAKGGVEMRDAGVSIEKISALMGHESVTTTETYLRRHMRTVIEPNRRLLKA